MKNNFIKVLALTFLFSLATFGQTPTPAPEADDEVVKITTNLVQLDAVVTDKEGNHVTDLIINDFEVYQDGKLQNIAGLTYIDANASKQKNIQSKPVKIDKNVPVPPPARTNLLNAGRIITFVIDDCTFSFGSSFAAREGVEKFIREQMQPNDLVAIYRTRTNSSLLQQYTSDKAQLLNIAKKIHWLPSCGADGDVFQAITRDDTIKAPREGSAGKATFESEKDKQRRKAIEDFRTTNHLVGTIGTLDYVIRGLEKIPGRKTLFLISDGLALFDSQRFSKNNTALSVLEQVRHLADLANRASVVINAIDARGLVNTSYISGEDDIDVKGDPTATDKISEDRRNSLMLSRDGLFLLSNETGGTLYKDANYLHVPIRRALNLEKGYYLLAYEPEDETFRGKKYHKIEIKLKRPELRVRSRAGFYSVSDEDLNRRASRGKNSDLYEALISPVPNADLNLRASASFINSPTDGNFIRSLIHIDGKDISFTDAPNGKKKAVFDIVAVTLDEKNRIIDSFIETRTLYFAPQNVQTVLRDGLVYPVEIAVKNDGVYTFRVALRDGESKRLGSAHQLIEVPNLKKDKIFLSGLTLSTIDSSGKFILASTEKSEKAFEKTNALTVPALRRFRAGDVIAYAFTVYNAVNPANLNVQIRLYKDGEMILDAQPQQFKPENQNDSTRINDYGYLRLKPESETGDYALQVIVFDRANNKVSSQWIDFEVIN
jgi:VWFA-related protein